jgi:signal transduction histidine kinase
MNLQREFISESFHALSQPLAALRITVELALEKAPHEQAARRTLEDCLPLIDRLMQNLAVIREVANLDKEPPIEACDGHALLQSSSEEMALIARASGILLHFNADPAVIACHPPTLQRALFILLDEVIASAARNCTISVSLHRRENEFLLEVRPGPPEGLRQKLCCNLIQLAGGRDVVSTTGVFSANFQECSARHTGQATSHSPASRNLGVKDIA